MMVDDDEFNRLIGESIRGSRIGTLKIDEEWSTYNGNVYHRCQANTPYGEKRKYTYGVRNNKCCNRGCNKEVPAMIQLAAEIL